MVGIGRGRAGRLRGLGAAAIRQHGPNDLLWADLAGESAPIPVNVTELHALLFNETNRTRVRRLLGEARERGLRPVMTCFTLGGGTTGDRSTTIRTEDRVREAKALVVAWAPDHGFP